MHQEDFYPLWDRLPVDDFVLFLQPQFDLRTDSVCGAEVLLRWNHPLRGLLCPEAFFPELAAKGMQYDLDCMVLEKSCQLLRGWMDRGRQPYPLAINLFGKTPFRPQWTQWLVSLLGHYGVAPSQICLEIKEDSYIGSPRATHALVSELQEAGVAVALDNFGHDRTSIKTIEGMGMRMLKADMRFFEGCADVGRAEVVFSSAIKVASWLSMTVAAENVETRQQRDFAAAAGCDVVQGDWCRAAMTAEAFEDEYLAAKKTPGRGAAASKHSRTVLVIDDSEMERALMQKYLEGKYHIAACESAEEGLAYLSANKGRVQLVLVDNVMPGMSGMDFLRYCQRDEELKLIPKIMITSNDRPRDQIEAFHAGAYDFLNKPLVPEVVHARVQHVMELNSQLRTFESEEERYRQEAETDKATGLLNKTTFEERVRTYLSHYSGDPCALMVVDVDNFKYINDTYGHLHGDEVLRLIADTLTDHFRKTDYVGRFGGDEFVMLMTGLPSDELALQRAERVIRTVQEVCQKDLHMDASISVGLAFSLPGESFETYFERADQALYAAKKAGKHQVRTWQE